MKLTQRDKKLLIVLGVVIFTVVFLKFLMLPKLGSISQLKTDIAILNDSYAVNMAYKAKVKRIDGDIKILSKKLGDLREIYPPSIDSDELLVLMMNLTSEAGLEVKSISFGDIGGMDGTKADSKADPESESKDTTQKEEGTPDAKVDNISENGDGSKLGNGILSDIRNYFYLWGLKSKKNSVVDDAVPDGNSYGVSVKLEATGDNEQIKAYFDKLSKLKNKAICKAVSISPSQNGGQNDKDRKNLKLNAEIVFYGIMDKGAGDYYMLEDGKWAPIPANGKKDIFKSYSGFSVLGQSGHTQNTGINDTKNSVEDKAKSQLDEIIPGTYDFSVVASHFGGGLAPSVSINCKNPASSENSFSVVYGDNKGTENAEIFIEQKNGKYYCKFKTDHESYPDRQYSQTMEFIPVGEDLKLVIISSERQDENDQSGIKLNIINNSDKQFVYQIFMDDSDLPRVEIGKTVGKVIRQ
ncbi:hypothetical protein [Ruminiclostridium cellulolyticum]|uniref:Type IV pilus assembly protein PilO n=1 Tax=Ruminiclostridium cellulolyticum (strain ATCC 35319 / DSM 5812 / JCM 6584 / H10) TaxID=394503 RepID=B8I5K0_RUMCH|nr:hypothetical protein [Ruminiclostridium cellulolyticum]ACL76736.1 hypothetical protein Ccel_2406 [Ruminiclostridium cellulolyticum H10]